MSAGEPDYYELIGVNKGASLHEIRAEFRKKVLAEHPDKGGDPKKIPAPQQGLQCVDGSGQTSSL